MTASTFPAPRLLAPRSHISSADRAGAVRNLLIDAAAATAIGALNSGVVLLALALHIGASTMQVGLLAAIPLITQVLQAPAVKLVEALRRRRLISVAALVIARLALPVYAVVPFIADRTVAVSVLLGAALVHYGFNAVSACSWNSWIKDLIPTEGLGRFTSRRTLVGTAVSAVATLGAAIALNQAQGSEQAADLIFSGLYLFGFLCGVVSTVALARVPELAMPPRDGTAPLMRLLVQPLKDRNFRSLLRYLASWQFAVNLATPFITVYIVRELGFDVSFVLLLTLASQVANIAVVRLWGQVSDRFTNKTVLSAATPLYILCIVGMAFAGELSGSATRGAYLFLLHIVMGAAGAGVGIASGNIVMKLSPSEQSTSYMATNALIGALAAGVAPVIGGWAADFFARRSLSLELSWASPQGVDELIGLSFTHWEFFFLLSAVMGLYTLHRLSSVSEPGTVRPKELVQLAWSSAQRALRNASSVAGLLVAVNFPAADLIDARQRRRLTERVIDPSDPFRSSAREAMGFLLRNAFDEPSAATGDFDDVLARLDRVTTP
ncbi:MFS transporter [Sphingomonas arenae]|uniref:MFS transporter n=1 Tax=Sphingomonas arenae TaxID=2812555 RepID=UPI0019687B8E|nr:MFS transporter [Sphingomonas arenae]